MGQKVKVKVKDEPFPAAIEECHFVSKLTAFIIMQQLKLMLKFLA